MARRTCLAITAVLSLVPVVCSAASWYPLGPFGGDARAIAADPADSRHLYLGTEIGWLYDSHDAGVTWTRVSQIAKRDDLVLDHILVDVKNPRRLIVGAWRVGASDGGVYISEDSGKSWYAQAEMKRQSVRAMARSASNPQMIVAGTLQGVFRSDDNGIHWRLISPFESKEIHEVESLAIDPNDPKIIYAGTWHLPWKTVDGGENWVNVKQGIIDDSDVFSIIVDPENSKTVYLSACSGIYKSSDAAEQFHKIQGIPSTARRTRKLLQDPTDLNTVYAGTTEGLYKTTDAGRSFARLTSPEVIINDVYVDPKSPTHVLLATDRGGVLRSEDGGTTFDSSNTGFSARQISSFAAAPNNPSKIYVGVVNGKQTGGVFTSDDGGLKWQQQSMGLRGQDVFSLLETPAGTLLAGTGHGIYRYESDAWTQSSDLDDPAAKSTEERPSVKPHATKPGKLKSAPRPTASTRVHRTPAALDLTFDRNDRSLGSTRFQLANATVTKRRKPLAKKASARLTSAKQASVRRVPEPTRKPADVTPQRSSTLDTVIFALTSKSDTIYAGTDHGLISSDHDGHSWQKVDSLDMPEVRFLAIQAQTLVAAGLKQSAVSLDGGSTWNALALPEGLSQISAVAVDDSGTFWMGGVEGVFYSSDHGASWKTLRQLFLHSVTGIYADAAEHRVLVTSALSTYAFVVHVPDNKVTFADAGWPLRFVRPVGDHLLAATLFEGTVLQPVMVDTPFQSSEK